MCRLNEETGDSTTSSSRDLKVTTCKEATIQVVNILRPSRFIDLMIQQNVTTVPAQRARQSTIRKAAFRLRAQADVLGRVSRQIGAVHPEAEEAVRAGGGVVDEDLRDINVADEGFVVGC